MQRDHLDPSRLQLKVAGVSVAVNSNVALREVVTVVGPDVRLVSGAVVSAAGGGGGAGATIVQLRVAGVVSTFPAASVARTSNVWAPTARPESPSGEAQALQAPPSRRHWNVEPASVEVNDIGRGGLRRRRPPGRP